MVIELSQTKTDDEFFAELNASLVSLSSTDESEETGYCRAPGKKSIDKNQQLFRNLQKRTK